MKISQLFALCNCRKGKERKDICFTIDCKKQSFLVNCNGVIVKSKMNDYTYSGLVRYYSIYFYIFYSLHLSNIDAIFKNIYH